MGQKTYWRGVEDLKQDQGKIALEKQKENFELDKVFTEEKEASLSTNRRDFLKVLGFSVTAATVAASCKMPVRKAIPYINKPEEVLPGQATYYASSFHNGSEFANILVKTREGRPIKIEPNPQKGTLTKGTSSAAEASVLGLYDNYRLHGPMAKGKPSDWKTIDAALKGQFNSNPGQKIALISPSLISPSSLQLIKDLQARYSGLQHISYDSVSYAALCEQHKERTGRMGMPVYKLENAMAIVGINADFLGSWGFSQKYQADYAKNRKVSANKRKMSRHFQFESSMSITGSNADYRYSIAPADELQLVKSLSAAILGGSAQAAGKYATAEAIQACATYLKRNQGKSLVLSGSNNPEVQKAVAEMNTALGAMGSTIESGATCYLHQGSDAEMDEFITNMASYETVIFWASNPVYSHPRSSEIAAALPQIANSISLNDRVDETGVLCQYNCPDDHILESWNDAMPQDGHYALQQPTIAPLFDTRCAQESLMHWMGDGGNYHDLLKANFANWGGGSHWDQALHDGFAEVEISMPNTNSFSGVPTSNSGMGSGDYQLTFIQNTAIGGGEGANNPWLQEVPDPVSRVCWTNYLAMSAQEMESKGIKQGQMATISANGSSIKLPILSQPGLLEGCVAIAVGYGRQGQKQGKIENNMPCGSEVGANAFNIMGSMGSYRSHTTRCSIEVGAGDYDFPQTQMHHTIEGLLIDHSGEGKELDKRLTSNYSDTGIKGVGRSSVFKETTLAEYQKNPYAGNEDRAHVVEHLQTLYPEFPYEGHHWGMVIDLNACNGCNACVVSCNAENNIPVVGAREMHRAHEMHWLRIDRYYSGDVENPDVVFQPMLCQHCDNAPCENVCPVSATNHSTEGINQMAYNRCVGTRYCANNCPYKVRRFNWFDYQGADSFRGGTWWGNDKSPDYMLEDLTRMVLNPDVTVRSRGVMEKCTFCVQRIQEGKLGAKKKGEKLKDGAIVTACQSACATGAIKFGDLNDKDSEVHKLANLESGDERGFKVLEEIHVLPSITYLTKVRNRDES